MALQVIKGRISNYKRKREEASFVFTDEDREGLGMIAIAASLAGLSGQAISTASAAASAEEEADYLEFEIDGKPIKGWVWRSPFKEGDEVEVAAEWQKDHYELCAIARPVDQLVALYPHCSRGSGSHWRNAWKWWFLGTTLLIVAGIAFLELIGLFQSDTHSAGFHTQFLQVMILGLTGFFYPVFALMTWSLARKWMPFVRLSEKVFTAFGWEKPASVDLVKTTKRLRQGFDDAELGVFFFRYGALNDLDPAKDPIVSICGEIRQLTTKLDFDLNAYLSLTEMNMKRASNKRMELTRRDSLPEVVNEKDFPPSADELAAHHEFVSFALGGAKFEGQLWRNPFVEGDSVVVAAEREGDIYRVLGVARPHDRMIALYPRCTGSKLVNLRRTLRATTKMWLAMFSFFGLVTVFIFRTATLPSVIATIFGLTFLLCAGFYYIFIYRDQLLPMAKFSERVLRALNVPNPSNLDLVLRSKEGKKGDEPPEYGNFYFRY